MVLAVNKYDLIQDYEKNNQPVDKFMSEEYLQKFANENNFIGFKRTSAKTGENVNECVQLLIDKLVTESTFKNPKTGINELDFDNLTSMDGSVNQQSRHLSKFTVLSNYNDKELSDKKLKGKC